MSRSKKNWDYLVDDRGNYKPWPNGGGGKGGGSGAKGEKGSAGAKGEPGTAGTKGQKGDKLKFDDLTAGDRDKLKGESGDSGDKGNKGDKGGPGPKGASGGKGDTGSIGPKGSDGAGGVKGDEGDKGEKGEAKQVLTFKGKVPTEADLSGIVGAVNGDVYLAEDTDTLYVYADGSWVALNNVATPIKGEPGDKGDNGTKGDAGLKGNDGEKGNTGTKGEDGKEGVKGKKGEVGVGVKGDKGEVGAKGDEGPKGDDGDQGNKGEKGDPALIPEPADDDTVYGRSREKGEETGAWERAVALSGDSMSGPLSAPLMTVGPDADDKAVLYMSTGKDIYESGPHQLEARDTASVSSLFWKNRVIPDATNSTVTAGLTYGNDTWVICSQGKKNPFAWTNESLDTLTPAQTSPESQPGDTWRGVAYLVDTFYAWRDSADGGSSSVWQSVDGDTWEVIPTLSYRKGVVDMACYGSTKVIMGNDAVLSREGSGNWDQSTTIAGDWQSIVYHANSGKWMAFSGDTPTQMMSSENPTLLYNTVTAVPGVSGGGYKYFAVGSDGVIIGSDGAGNFLKSDENGENFSEYSVAGAGGVDLSFFEGYYVGLGPDKAVGISVDGVEWEFDELCPTVGSAVYYAESVIAVTGTGSSAYFKNLDSSLTNPSLYFDGDLIATSKNLAPVVEEISNISLEINNLTEGTFNVQYGEELPASDPGGEPIPTGRLFFHIKDLKLFIRVDGYWLALS